MKCYDSVLSFCFDLRLADEYGPEVPMTVMNVNIINTGLAGAILAPELWMATLPLSLQFVAVMLATLPASLLMARVGRRPVFLCGVAIYNSHHDQALAIITGQFGMFVMGSVSVGGRAWCCPVLSLRSSRRVARSGKTKGGQLCASGWFGGGLNRAGNCLSFC